MTPPIRSTLPRSPILAASIREEAEPNISSEPSNYWDYFTDADIPVWQQL